MDLRERVNTGGISVDGVSRYVKGVAREDGIVKVVKIRDGR